MHLSLASLRPAIADTQANLATMEDVVRDAKGDTVLFGELFTSGYVARDAFGQHALAMDGPEMARLVDLAKETDRNIIFGFPRAHDAARGVLYDAAGLVTRHGKTDYYDKLYPANFGPFEERLYFAQGDALRLWDLDGIKVGPQICYDLFFPEITKAYALMGADLLINLSASPNVSRRFFEQIFPARALETGCFFAYCNVAGTQEDLVFWAGSQLWGPRGDQKVVAPYFDESVVDYEFDVDEATNARPLRPTARDTRADVMEAMKAAAKPDAT